MPDGANGLSEVMLALEATERHCQENRDVLIANKHFPVILYLNVLSTVITLAVLFCLFTHCVMISSLSVMHMWLRRLNLVRGNGSIPQQVTTHGGCSKCLHCPQMDIKYAPAFWLRSPEKCRPNGDPLALGCFQPPIEQLSLVADPGRTLFIL